MWYGSRSFSARYNIHSSLDRNIPTDAIFIDFEKAFDKVPYARLVLKLPSLNLHPCVVNCIHGFLTCRPQFVYVNYHSSSSTPVLSGEPQGTVLGPLLFFIYINDLASNISSGIRLFADDCVIYRPITNSSDNSALQDYLNRIQDWCNTWLMSLNVFKTKLISFQRRRNHVLSNYTLNNQRIQTSDSLKYLGVHISSDLTWSTHINSVANSANRLLGYLRRNLALTSPAVKLLAYKTFVRAKLEYANAIFYPY